MDEKPPPQLKVGTLLICFLLSISLQTTISPLTYAYGTREWTFIVYLDADNDLESAGIKDLNEMETVGSSNSLAIIVQIDRIQGYDSSNGGWTETRRYYVTQDNDMENINSDLVGNMGELNMGDASTLSSFVIWAIQNYPAQHYALILSLSCFSFCFAEAEWACVAASAACIMPSAISDTPFGYYWI
ncbi:MAG: clostripain-related cysteine peptidase [Candidatus Bathyarchaeia archaeon]